MRKNFTSLNKDYTSYRDTKSVFVELTLFYEESTLQHDIADLLRVKITLNTAKNKRSSNLHNNNFTETCCLSTFLSNASAVGAKSTAAAWFVSRLLALSIAYTT